MQGTWLPVCALEHVPVNGIRRVVIPALEPLAVCRTETEVFVVNDMCTHGLASLSEGEIQDRQIICPYHGGAFDMATGEPVGPPCTVPITAFKTRVEAEHILIFVSDSPGG